jgi:hypothetical protein
MKRKHKVLYRFAIARLQNAQDEIRAMLCVEESLEDDEAEACLFEVLDGVRVSLEEEAAGGAVCKE